MSFTDVHSAGAEESNAAAAFGRSASPGSKGRGKGPQLPGSTVFVFHLPNSWGEAELQRHFRHCGHIVKCQVQQNPEGLSRGFGFVTFDSPEGARKAVVGMHGFPAGGKFLKVNIKQGEEYAALPIPAYPPPGRLDTPVGSEGTAAPPGATLFVFHLPNSWTETELLHHFIHCGTILGLSVMRRPTGESRGFGFVSYADPASAQRAVDGMHGFATGEGKFLKVQMKRGHEDASAAAAAYMPQQHVAYAALPNGGSGAVDAAYEVAVRAVQKLLHLSFAGRSDAGGAQLMEAIYAEATARAPRGGRGAAGMAALPMGFAPPPQAVQSASLGAVRNVPAGANLYIFHLPNTWSEVELEQCFSAFGNVISTSVQRHADGSSRGFGFVGFDTAESAAAAIAGANGLKVDGKVLTVQPSSRKGRSEPY